MPENPAALHVLGVTGTGRLMHTIRTPGGWTGFVDVLGPEGADQPEAQGYVTEVAAARLVNLPGAAGAPTLPEGLVVAVLVSTQPSPLFFFRYADTGRWVPMGTATGVLGARRIAATAANAYHDVSDGGTGQPGARLHLGWTGRAGQLLVTSLWVPVPGTDGQVVTAENTTGLSREGFRVPALAGGNAAGEAAIRLRLAGLTADGRMYRSIVTAEGPSEVLGDVEAGAGEAGEIVDTALAVADHAESCEYYAAVTGDGRILLAANTPAGDEWTTWRDLEETDFVLIGQGMTITYREVAEFGTFARVALASTADGLHVLGVTTSGRLLHQLQAGLAAQPGDGQEFRDVELAGVGTDVGDFVAVAAA